MCIGEESEAWNCTFDSSRWTCAYVGSNLLIKRIKFPLMSVHICNSGEFWKDMLIKILWAGVWARSMGRIGCARMSTISQPDDLSLRRLVVNQGEIFSKNFSPPSQERWNYSNVYNVNNNTPNFHIESSSVDINNNHPIALPRKQRVAFSFLSSQFLILKSA